MHGSKGGPTGARWRRPGPLVFGIALVLVAVLVVPSVSPGPDGAARYSVARAPAIAPAATFLHWSTFHGSENHSGYSPINGPSVGTISWDFGPPHARPVAIRTGIVADDTAIYFSDAFGTVWAYNRSNATPAFLWNYSLGTTTTTGDLWGGEIVIGGSNGRVDALSTANGTLLWSAPVDGAVPQGVAIDNGTVFAGTSNGTVWALDALTGLPIWSRPIGGAVAGSVAVEGNTLVAATISGGLVGLDLNGSVRWTTNVGAPMRSGPALFGTAVVVADVAANISRYSLLNGSRDWRFVEGTRSPGDFVNSTPAVDPERVYVATTLGQVVAVSLANGSLVWNRSTGFTGYDVLSSPAIAPNGLYVSDAYQYVDDFSPTNGSTIWRQSLGYFPAYGPIALDGGLALLGVEIGTVLAFGPVGGGATYPVAGTVASVAGVPLAGATVTVGVRSVRTDANGSFSLQAVNGTYPVTVAATGYVSTTSTLIVAGPTTGLRYILAPVPLALVTGRVIDDHTLHPLGGVPVLFFGPFGSFANTTTAPNGSFALLAPIGLDYVTASPPNGYGPYADHVTVPATGLTGLEIRLPVAAGALDGRLVWAPLAAIGLALLSIWVWDATRRRRELGLPPGLLSPFATYVAMRSILLGFQAVAILSILYVFGTMLPAVSQHVSPCAFIDTGCQPGGWSNSWNIPLAFGYGMGHFIVQLVTGDWGTTTFGHLRQPAAQFLVWYLPNSIELALFALPIAATIAYLVGLWAGAHPESTFDSVARLGSIAGLLLPSFLIVLLFLGAFYGPFLHALGDTPYGFLPTQLWYVDHPFPSWIGTGGNTTPTGFPIVDGAVHGNWPFVELVLLKTLWQAFAIAVVYVSIYLRFVRHAVAEAFREPIVVAARARGIPESTILWRHTGRRVLPLLVLVFGLTLPLYLGTQALVESLAQDNGIGGLLVSQMTQAVSSGFGFKSLAPGRTPQSFYQVTIFLLVLVVLAGHLVSDVVARYLDPRLLRAPR